MDYCIMKKVDYTVILLEHLFIVYTWDTYFVMDWSM